MRWLGLAGWPAALLAPTAVFAHAGERHLAASEVARWWSWDPLVVGSLVVSAALYALGARRLWRRAGPDRGLRRWEAAAFGLGWLALVVALVSPLDALGGILFSAHMAQHEVLMLVAAPLLVLGRPLAPFLWGLPPRWRERMGHGVQAGPAQAVWRAMTGPLTVWALHGAALWLWHLPGLYQATLGDEVVHALQHSCFLGTALLFWWALIHGRYGRGGYGVAVLYVFTTALHSSILGALLTFAPRLWYPIYEARTRAWGLAPLEDQQLAGLLMWVPSGVIFVVLGLALFAAWMGEAERRSAIADRRRLAGAGLAVDAGVGTGAGGHGA